MKVLQINSVCGIRSTGRITTDLYKVLEDAGHECVIGYGRLDAPKDINSIKIGSNLDNYVHVSKTRIFDKHGFSSSKATNDFLKKVDEYNPDVVHLHNIHGYYINIEILFKYLKKINKPVVWTLHDCWSFTGHCSHFDYIGCEKWKSKCYDCPQKMDYPNSLLMDNSKWNYEKKKELFTSIENMTIITPSKWLADLVSESYLGKYKVQVVNNGIDLDQFRPINSNFREKYNLENKFLLLGVASQWGERKGLLTFIELAEKLDSSYKVILVGVTEKEKSELPSNIISITRTNNIKELAEIYTAVDLFVNPTLEDTFPTTNLEALACGTPIVTFNTGGSIESVDKNCGIVVKNNDYNELYAAIKNIKENGKEYYSEYCINKSRELYNKNDKFKEYVTIYESVMNK